MNRLASITLTLLLLIPALLFVNKASAQWTAPYANSWIRYDKPYVKVSVFKKGIFKIPFSSLPKNFPVNAPEKFQLWRRGKEVTILSTTNKEILFFGVPNDGASDSRLYRPASSRVNPYFSMYSDEGAYFLTIGDSPGKRAKVVDQPVDSKIPLMPYHRELAVRIFQQEYSLSTEIAVKPAVMNSYFEYGASRTGYKQNRDSVLTVKFQLKNRASTAEKAILKMLLHGRSGNQRKMEVYIGKNVQALRLATSLTTYGFNPAECSFEIKQEDLDEKGNGVLRFKSISDEKSNRFSLAYLTTEFSQLLDAESQRYKEFRFTGNSGPWSRIAVKGTGAKPMFFEISDADNPMVIKGGADNLMFPRQSGKTQILLATDEVTEASVKEISFKTFNPKEADYLIVTSPSLMEGAQQYAAYRGSKAGGSYKPLVVNVEDIYNQFNYGEISPLAIRKFMSYMLGEGGREKYLFLIGRSITHNERMKRELPDEVPTIGYPASDVLLVDGLAGEPFNYPACPVGRLSALNNQSITDYLEKVKEYEANSAGDYSWRKRILHLNGGKNTSEINQFRGMLQSLEPAVSKGVLGGEVKAYAKQQAMGEVESVNITADVNAGVGLITYFGHGSTIETDLNMGYATDAARAYQNPGRYPLMYFNGCGVGNVFAARFNPKPKNPRAGDRIPLSLDWLLAPRSGAIAVIANSFESHVSPASGYLHTLYKYMFNEEATADLSIGKIQQAVAKDILDKNPDEYSIANIHQTMLQGDPALRVITVDKPDYALDPDQSISLHALPKGKTFAQCESVSVNIRISNAGRYLKNQNIPVTVTALSKKGNLVKSFEMPAFALEDTLEITLPASRDIQGIQVQIDPENTIAELRESNNVAELTFDWNFLQDKNTFSYEHLKDNIAPVLQVRHEGRLIRQDEIIKPQPQITFFLSDDRQLIADTALIEVYIKPCGNDKCSFEKISFSAGRLQLSQTETKTLQLDYISDLTPGIYEILVNAKDRSGNAAAQPYRIRFQVGAFDHVPELIVSPNPASEYVRFELRKADPDKVIQLHYTLYNMRGDLVTDKVVEPATSLTREWYWIPSQVVPGLYTYKVVLTNDKSEIRTFTGKLVLK